MIGTTVIPKSKHAMTIKNVFVALAAFALPAFPASYSLELKPETTKIQWTLSDPLHGVQGTLNLKGGSIDFDTDTGKASGQVIVDVAGGKSGNDSRDRKMHSSVLESGKYPETVFTASRIDGAVAIPGSSKVRILGTFAIHGSTHDVTMDVQETATGDQVHSAIAFDIPYVAWGMKDPSNFLLKVGKTVQVSIDVTGQIRKK
jgi:polyisoprenoid-binding protein YceI